MNKPPHLCRLIRNVVDMLARILKNLSSSKSNTYRNQYFTQSHVVYVVHSSRVVYVVRQLPRKHGSTSTTLRIKRISSSQGRQKRSNTMLEHVLRDSVEQLSAKT
jgi:hypothetical protein